MSSQAQVSQKMSQELQVPLRTKLPAGQACATPAWPDGTSMLFHLNMICVLKGPTWFIFISQQLLIEQVPRARWCKGRDPALLTKTHSVTSRQLQTRGKFTYCHYDSRLFLLLLSSLFLWFYSLAILSLCHCHGKNTSSQLTSVRGKMKKLWSNAEWSHPSPSKMADTQLTSSSVRINDGYFKPLSLGLFGMQQI